MIERVFGQSLLQKPRLCIQPVIDFLYGAPFCVWASGWGGQGAVLGWQHQHNFSSLFSHKYACCLESSHPRTLDSVPSTNLLEQSLSLFGCVLSKLL